MHTDTQTLRNTYLSMHTDTHTEECHSTVCIFTDTPTLRNTYQIMHTDTQTPKNIYKNMHADTQTLRNVIAESLRLTNTA